jgi:hypothetical protein
VGSKRRDILVFCESQREIRWDSFLVCLHTTCLRLEGSLNTKKGNQTGLSPTHLSACGKPFFRCCRVRRPGESVVAGKGVFQRGLSLTVSYTSVSLFFFMFPLEVLSTCISGARKMGGGTKKTSSLKKGKKPRGGWKKNKNTIPYVAEVAFVDLVWSCWR